MKNHCANPLDNHRTGCTFSVVEQGVSTDEPPSRSGHPAAAGCRSTWPASAVALTLTSHTLRIPILRSAAVRAEVIGAAHGSTD